MSIKNIVTSQVPEITEYDAGGNITGIVVANVTATDITVANSITATTFIGDFQGNISGNLVVPGSNTWVLYNNQGNAGADVGFTYNAATKTANVGNTLLAGNVTVSGQVSAVGNVHGAYIFGNGSQLTGLPALYGNANVEAYLPTSNTIIGIDSNVANLSNSISNTNSNVTNVVTALNSTNSNVSNVASNVTTLQGQVYTNANVSSYLGSNANVVISTTANITTTANVTAAYLHGDGSNITGLPAAYGNADVEAYLPTSNVIIGINSNVANTNSNVANTNANVANLTTALGNTNSNVANLTTSLGNTNSNVANLTTSLGNTDANVANLVTITTNTNSNVANLTTDLANTNSNVANIASNGNALANSIANTNSNVANTNSNVANISSNVTTLQGQVYANANARSYLASNANVVITTTGNITTTANISGAYILGNGSQLTGLPAQYGNANVEAYLPTSPTILAIDANVANTNSNVANLTTSLANTDANVANVESNVSGLLSNVNILQGQVYANANVADYLPTYSGNITANDIATTIISATLATSANVTITSSAGNGAVFYSGAGGEVLTSAGINYDSNTATLAATNFSGDGSLLTNLNAGNITGLYNDSNVAAFLPTYTGNLTAGNAVITGNLLVQGTTTTVDSNNVSINDLVFNVANNANAAIYANGAGLGVGTVNTEYALFTWNSTSDTWTSSNNLSAIGNVQGTYVLGNGSQLTGMYSNTNVGAYLPTYAGNVGGTLTTNSQPYITTVGTLGSLAVTNNVNANGLGITGNATIGNLVVTGNVTLPGNINQITGNQGAFYGDAFGFGALYAGIASGFANLPATVTQFSANYPDYAQLNFQNINSGAGASADYVATADNGTNTTYYVDLGIASSTYDGLSANALGTSVKANDAYLYTFGNTSGDNGGNLILGAGTIGKEVKVIAGGGATVNIVAVFANTGLTVTGLISSTGNVISGNVTTVGLVSATGNVTAGNINTAGLASVTGNVVAGNINTTGVISATGNVTGNYILGNGSLLTGLSTSTLSNGTSNISIAAVNGNITMSVAGGSNFNLTANSVAVGLNAGLAAQSTTAVAIGANAGANSQSANSIAIGTLAGAINQGTNTISIGTLAGNAGPNATSTNAFITSNVLTTLGNITGTFTGTMLITGSGIANNTVITTTAPSTITNAQITGTELRLYAAPGGQYPLLVGAAITGNGVTANTYVTTQTRSLMAGSTISGTTLTVGTLTGDPIQVGMYIGSIAAGTYIVSNLSGSGDGSTWQVSVSQTIGPATLSGYIWAVNQSQTVGPSAMAATYYAVSPTQTVAGPIVVTGSSGQGANSIAIGYQAGNSAQGITSVAIGVRAGNLTQGANTVAIGSFAGGNTQGASSVAIGAGAGVTAQGVTSVAVGPNAGAANQANQSVAIGYNAGQNTQGVNAVAVGTNAGQSTQGGQAIAIGVNAALSGQGSAAVAVGFQAGSAQGASAVAIGSSAGATSQGGSAVAVGQSAGQASQGTNAVAVGLNSGLTGQGVGAIGIGQSAGQQAQGVQAVGIGYTAGQFYQSTNGVAIGYSPGTTTQGANSVAIGSFAATRYQFTNSVAIGNNAGRDTQRTGAIAIGNAAGFSGANATSDSSTVAGNVLTVAGNVTGTYQVGMALTNTGNSSLFITSFGTGNGGLGTYNLSSTIAANIGPGTGIVAYLAQGNNAIAMGNAAGYFGQGANAIAVGYLAGNSSQGTQSVAIGQQAGQTTQGTQSVAIGQGAGTTSQGAQSVAVGQNAGASSQGVTSVAVGPSAGGTSQGNTAVAIGYLAAGTSQGIGAVAIGQTAARNNQGLRAIAIGDSAAFSASGTGAISMGYQTSYFGSGSGAIAIGYQACGLSGAQGTQSIAIGQSAAQTSQGNAAIAIGTGAGSNTQGINAVAIGTSAGANAQGANSVAIGRFAGQTTQVANSIIINGSGAALNADNAGLYVAPVRNDTGNTTNVVYFNTSTKELTYGPSSGTPTAIINGTSNVSIDSSGGNITLAVGGNLAATFTSGNTFINNIRSDSGNVINQVFYNTTTEEITYSPLSNSVITFNSTTVTSNVVNNYDCASTQIFYVDISGATSNWGVNLANLSLSNSAVSTVTFLLDPVGATTVYNPFQAFQVGGSNVTPRWVNGVQPPMVAGYINTLTYSLLNNSGNIVVLASSSNYS